MPDMMYDLAIRIDFSCLDVFKVLGCLVVRKFKASYQAKRRIEWVDRNVAT
jgi:hypothetical protein